MVHLTSKFGNAEMLSAGRNCLRKCFLRQIIARERAHGQPIRPQLPVRAAPPPPSDM